MCALTAEAWARRLGSTKVKGYQDVFIKGKRGMAPAIVTSLAYPSLGPTRDKAILIAEFPDGIIRRIVVRERCDKGYKIHLGRVQTDEEAFQEVVKIEVSPYFSAFSDDFVLSLPIKDQIRIVRIALSLFEE